MENIQQFTSRMVRSVELIQHYTKTIGYHLTQALFPEKFTLDIIKGDTGNYSLRFIVKPLVTGIHERDTNEIIDESTASFLLKEIAGFMVLPSVETMDQFESVSISRTFTQEGDSILVVSPKYRMSFSCNSTGTEFNSYTRVDTSALDESCEPDMLDEVLESHGATRTIEDGDLVYVLDSEETRYHEVVRLQDMASKGRTFRQELQERYEENVQAL